MNKKVKILILILSIIVPISTHFYYKHTTNELIDIYTKQLNN